MHAANQENGTPQALNSISAEISFLKENDPDIKKRYEIKDDFIKSMLNSIDKAYLIESRDSWTSKTPYYFFLNIFPGYIIEKSHTGGLILLNEHQAPLLHTTVQKLCDKLKIPKPALFLSGDPELFNAYASSLCDNLSLLVIGEKLLHALSEEELESLFAHELTHIKKSHVPKMLAYSGISLAATIFIIKKFCFPSNNKKTENPGVTQTFITTPGGILLTIAGVSLGSELLQQILSRYFEKEADLTSIEITDNPEGFVNMIQKLEDNCQEKFDSYNKDYLYLQEKIEALRKDHPKYARYLNFFATMNHLDKLATLRAHKESNLGTHPSLTTRKEYGNEYIAKKKAALAN